VVQFFPAADDATAPKKADVVSPSPADVPVLPAPSPAPSTTGSPSPTEASPGQTARLTPRAPGNGITLPGDTGNKGQAVPPQLPEVPGTSPKLPSNPRAAVPTQSAPIEHPTPGKP
jgi:hypothetical protein